MYISKSLIQENAIANANTFNNQKFKQLLSELQLYYRDNDIFLSERSKLKLLSAYWDTTYYLFKYTPIHDILLSYIGSYFCIQKRIRKKAELLQAITELKDNTTDISIEWGLKCWIVLLNNTTFRFPQVALNRIMQKMKPILDFYYSSKNN